MNRPRAVVTSATRGIGRVVARPGATGRRLHLPSLEDADILGARASRPQWAIGPQSLSKRAGRPRSQEDPSWSRSYLVAPGRILANGSSPGTGREVPRGTGRAGGNAAARPGAAP